MKARATSPSTAPIRGRRRAEQRHHRRLHGRGDVHRHRIHTDEALGLRRERGELLERKPAREVHRGLAQSFGDAADVLAFGLVRAAVTPRAGLSSCSRLMNSAHLCPRPST